MSTVGLFAYRSHDSDQAQPSRAEQKALQDHEKMINYLFHALIVHENDWEKISRQFTDIKKATP